MITLKNKCVGLKPLLLFWQRPPLSYEVSFFLKATIFHPQLTSMLGASPLREACHDEIQMFLPQAWHCHKHDQHRTTTHNAVAWGSVFLPPTGAKSGSWVPPGFLLLRTSSPGTYTSAYLREQQWLGACCLSFQANSSEPNKPRQLESSG